MSVFFRRGCLLVVLVLLPFIIASSLAYSNPKTTQKTHTPSAAKALQPSQPSRTDQTTPTTTDGLRCDAKAAVLMDALSGQILYEQDAQIRIPPASFVKLLTLYLAFDAIRAGRLKMEDMPTVSQKAWKIQGSKMFIKVGDRVKVEDLLKGIAVASGNDACIALAEHMVGTEEVFVSKMNEKAAFLGMKDSRFMNSHGMPDEGQYTTAMDIAILAKRYIEDHPEALAFHSTTEFEYNGIRQGNRNVLLQKNIGVDGLKTGHIQEAGYHLVATAKREGQRMIAVVMGCDRVRKRAPEVQKLLEYGFKNFSTVEPAKKGATFGSIKVKRGKESQVALIIADDARVTVAKGKENSVTAVPQLPSSVVAPIKKGQVLAKIIVQNEGKTVKEVNLVSSTEIEKSLIPSWPVLAGGFAGLVIVILGGFWWFRRPKQQKF